MGGGSDNRSFVSGNDHEAARSSEAVRPVDVEMTPVGPATAEGSGSSGLSLRVVVTFVGFLKML